MGHEEVGHWAIRLFALGDHGRQHRGADLARCTEVGDVSTIAWPAHTMFGIQRWSPA
jgi:hypothetical protein